jgi:hypothetical protein
MRAAGAAAHTGFLHATLEAAMDVTRVRFGSVLEWFVAGTLIVAAMILGGEVVRQTPSVRAVMPVIADEAIPLDPPARVPARAVSLPLLLLNDGKEVRLELSAGAIAELLGPQAQIGAETVERRQGRERITRAYAYAGHTFDLVFESTGQSADLKVTAIYLH